MQSGKDLTTGRKPRVLMAMSGGIDSGVSAMLLKEQGYELVGVTFRTFDSIPADRYAARSHRGQRKQLRSGRKQVKCAGMCCFHRYSICRRFLQKFRFIIRKQPGISDALFIRKDLVKF